MPPPPAAPTASRPAPLPAGVVVHVAPTAPQSWAEQLAATARRQEEEARQRAAEVAAARRAADEREALLDALSCSVCLEPCRSPAVLLCGHAFCRELCLQPWLATSRTCPFCRAPVPASAVPAVCGALAAAVRATRGVTEAAEAAEAAALIAERAREAEAARAAAAAAAREVLDAVDRAAAELARRYERGSRNQQVELFDGLLPRPQSMERAFEVRLAVSRDERLSVCDCPVAHVALSDREVRRMDLARAPPARAPAPAPAPARAPAPAPAPAPTASTERAELIQRFAELVLSNVSHGFVLASTLGVHVPRAARPLGGDTPLTAQVATFVPAVEVVSVGGGTCFAPRGAHDFAATVAQAVRGYGEHGVRASDVGAVVPPRDRPIAGMTLTEQVRRFGGAFGVKVEVRDGITFFVDSFSD